jgi:hypothetical protein
MCGQRRWVLMAFPLALIAAAVSGCAGRQAHATETSGAMAPMSMMPVEVRDAPVVVQQAYQYAAANADILSQIPCYCGCGAMGHTSNYACYVAGTDADGGLRFDLHALGCSICVDITQDVMRMRAQELDVGAIREAIDTTYSRYGPSNMP